jgi:hypothetical protein
VSDPGPGPALILKRFGPFLFALPGPLIEFGFTCPGAGHLQDRKAPMSENKDDGKVTTTLGGRQIFWLGHLCEGEPAVPGIPETFILRTRCGRYCVPPGEATERQPEQVVTCAKCKKIAAAERIAANRRRE